MIDELDYNNVCQKAIEHFGEAHQMAKIVEECAELTVAIMHEDYDRQNLIEEVADVTIMMRQAALMLGPKNVASAIREKLERLEERIASETRLQANAGRAEKLFGGTNDER